MYRKKQIKNYMEQYAGRITKGAAYAMQTRVFLYEKKYEEVKKAFKNLKDLNEYELVEDYGYQFRLEGEHCKESILEVNMYNSPTQGYWNTNNGNRHVIMSMPRNMTIGYGCAQPTKDLADAYDRAGDQIRKNATLLSNAEAVEIEKEAKGFSYDIVIIEDNKEAYKYSLEEAEETDLVLWCGSLYLVGKILSFVKK